jgi:tetratricopeptide (TPR) repeat protein
MVVRGHYGWSHRGVVDMLHRNIERAILSLRVCIFACLAVSAGLAQPAHAQTQRQIDQCVNNDKTFSPDVQLQACSAVIQSGKLTRENLAAAYTNRGLVFERKRDLERAIANYYEAIRLDPKYASAYNNRCHARAVVGNDFQGALADCNESLRLRPDDANTLNSRGLVQLKRGTYDRAVADYSAAIAKDEKDANSLYGRGTAKLRSGDTAGGNADIAAAKAIKPDIDTVYAGYGVK